MRKQMMLYIAVWLMACAVSGSHAANLCVYFDQQAQQTTYTPQPFTIFNAYLFLKQTDYGVTGVEYMLRTLDDPSHALMFIIEVGYPDAASIYIGDPFLGHSIAYWPPLDGSSQDYMLMCSYQIITTDACYHEGGTLWDYPLVIDAHPDSGYLRGTFYPDHEFFNIFGLTSLICPTQHPPQGPPELVGAQALSSTLVEAEFDRSISDWGIYDLDNYRVYEKYDTTATIPVTGASYGDEYHILHISLGEELIPDTTYIFWVDNLWYEVWQMPGPETAEFIYEEPPNAVMLESCDAQYKNQAIEVSWRLSYMDIGTTFHIRRAEENRDLEDINSPRIDSSGLSFRFVDDSVLPGNTYRYRVEYDAGGPRQLLFETGAIQTPGMPLALYQNTPNPFNPATTIRYYLPSACRVTLEIFDVSGRRVRSLVERDEQAGMHSVTWDGCSGQGDRAVSGVYFYRLRAGKEVISRKMVLLK
jgi:hypothetical protein